MSAATPVKEAKAPKAPKAAAKPRKLATHPPANTMVVEAVAKLNEKGGSSLIAIKKFISGFYSVDADKLAPFIRKALKKQVEAGKLTQPKGTGASGSFKLAVKAKAAAKPKKAAGAAAKPKVKKPKAAGVKKPKSPKKTKAAAKPKTPKAKKPAAAKKPKTPKAKVAKKAKTPKAAAAKKPKAPKKPKTMKAKTPAKPKAAKKTAPKKA